MSAPGLACPCCGYLTLPSHGTFDICPVCFWEDDFTVDQEDDLTPNHMCLFDARASFVAWGAVDPELVHWTRPPRHDEAPEGTPHRGERPYDRWPTLPVDDRVHFGWIGPPPAAFGVRDGFLVLDDGRRAGLRLRGEPDAAAPSVQPAAHVGRERDGVFEVCIPADGPDTGQVLDALRGGLAAAIVAMLPAPHGSTPWSPRRQYLETFRGYGNWGHSESRWEASPDDVDRVSGWAEAELRRDLQPADRFRVTGPRSWAHHRDSADGSTIRIVEVYDPAAEPLPPESPATWPAGTRCLLAWSTSLSLSPPPPVFPSSSDSYPTGPPPFVVPPAPPPARRRWFRRGPG